MSNRRNTAMIDTYRLPQELLDEVMSPALVIFFDHVRHNVHAMIEAAGGSGGTGAVGGGADRWRPHLKTTKSPVVWHELVDEGIRHFKCATTREAAYLLEVLDDCEIDDGDLLIAYPLLGPGLQRAGRLAEMHPQTRVSVLCEDAQAIAGIPESLGVFVDVNPQMNRTGVPIEQVQRVIEIATRAGDRDRAFQGVHFYDGHVRDDNPARRQARAHALYGQLLEIRAALLEAGCEVPELITSGTLTFEAALNFEPFTALAGTSHRISPGTVVFHDEGSVQKSLATPLRPAAMLLCRVISRPADDVITVDAGSKSIAAEVGDPCAMVLDHPHLTPMSPSEEHLPIHVDLARGAAPSLGDVLLLVPMHICPTVNLAEHAIMLEDGELSGVIDIAARGHELTA